MNTKAKTVVLAWYFRPWPIIFIYLVGGFVAPYFGYFSTSPALRLGGMIIYFAVTVLWGSWSTLLYRFLATHAAKDSRHHPGRWKHLYGLLIISVFITVLLVVLGATSTDRLVPADLIILPMFYALFRLNWRASDLLVELEGRDSFKHPDPVLRAFLAMFYLPIFMFWFAKRLRRLKASGKI